MLADGVLWVGGSSGLARTFFEERVGPLKGERFICTGVEPDAPEWLLGVPSLAYVPLDLTSAASVGTLFQRLPHGAGTLVIGARLPLLGSGAHTTLLPQLGALVAAAAVAGVRRVLHVSSVAAADHLRAQRGVDEEAQLPPLSEYAGEYDVFKRCSEEEIGRACEAAGLPHVHLRLSAIFSNEPQCIQAAPPAPPPPPTLPLLHLPPSHSSSPPAAASRPPPPQVRALALQAHAGAYLPVLLDANSSRNVCTALRLLLERLEAEAASVRRLYYYTRPRGPAVPYGEHLVAYRAAHATSPAVWLPYLAVAMLVALWHAAVRHTPLGRLAGARSVDYLLQVSSRDHTFDNGRIHRDFPSLAASEESLVRAFRRIEARALQRRRAGRRRRGTALW